MAVMFVSLYAGMSFGFGVTQFEREDLRATQILLERLEGVPAFYVRSGDQHGHESDDVYELLLSVGGCRPIEGHRIRWHDDCSVKSCIESICDLQRKNEES